MTRYDSRGLGPEINYAELEEREQIIIQLERKTWAELSPIRKLAVEIAAHAEWLFRIADGALQKLALRSNQFICLVIIRKRMKSRTLNSTGPHLHFSTPPYAIPPAWKVSQFRASGETGAES